MIETSRDRVEGTWRINGVYHVFYRTIQASRDKAEFWFNTACGFASSILQYDFNAVARNVEGKPVREPRAYRKDPTCLTCIVLDGAPDG